MTGEDNIKHKNPFRVPENYFEQVNSRILASTVEKSKAGRFTLRQVRPVLAIAAALAVLVMLGVFSTGLFTDRVSADEISQIMEVNPEIFLEEMDLMTLESGASESDFEDGSLLSDDEIIDYLLSEDIDVSMIYGNI